MFLIDVFNTDYDKCVWTLGKNFIFVDNYCVGLVVMFNDFVLNAVIRTPEDNAGFNSDLRIRLKTLYDFPYVLFSIKASESRNCSS